MKGTFRSLAGFNYRVWVIGGLVSNIGTWMQRIAQDWLVLTVLTNNSATALGVLTALQFGPHLFLLPLTGFAADHFDRRKLVFLTQSAMGLLALGLGVLTIAGLVELWHVYVFALLQGCVTAFDSPARQTFVAELVDDHNLSNAVALNSTSFNTARLIGPAVAGVVIAAVGSGWAFVANAASFGAVLVALGLLRVDELHRKERKDDQPKGLADGIRYVWGRPDLKALVLMLGILGTFGLNFSIFIPTMAVSIFQAGASQYGMLVTVMAIGSVAGALYTAQRASPRFPGLVASATCFGIGCMLAALMPNYWLFGLMLVFCGMAAQSFTISGNTLVQLSTAPEMRGRVMAIVLALGTGGALLGGPVVGGVADRFGPRWALGVGAASGFAAALIALGYLARLRREQRP